MPATRRNRTRRAKKAPYSTKGQTRNATPFDDAVPPLRQVEHLPSHDNIRLENDKGESDMFRPGDCVFVVHEDTDRTRVPLDGHQYWKAQIVSIHQLRSKWWIVVSWFYTSTQLRGLGMLDLELVSLGNTELVRSNHRDVIPFDCIEAHCKIQHWDDTDPMREWLLTNTWYYRLDVEFQARRKPRLQGVRGSCLCDKFYSPSLDDQRYCDSCANWFHVNCLELHESEGPHAGFMPASEQLKKVPVMRGWGGGSGQPWETVGNARKLAAFNRWAKKGPLPQDWNETLGRDFISAMTGKKWARYTCPGCSSKI